MDSIIKRLTSSARNALGALTIQKAEDVRPLTYDAEVFLNDYIAKSSRHIVPSFYDVEDVPIQNKERPDKTDVTDTDAVRRAIHTISNYYNTLGVYRDDFDKNNNDKLARNAYYVLCEKAIQDYLGSATYKVIDKDGEPVEIAMDFLDAPNPQEDFGTLMKMAVRDLVRYDAGVWVKSFNIGGYLTEMKAYLATEFWKEQDRVAMIVNMPFSSMVNIDRSSSTFATHWQPAYTGWWSHGYTQRYWQRSRTGVYIPFQPEEITYFMMYPRSDGIYGTDFIKYLRYQLQYLIDSTKAAGKTYENGLVPSIVWMHDNVKNIQQLEQRIKEVRASNQGVNRFGSVLHTVSGEKVETLAQTLLNMQWLEGQKFVAQLIWAMWGFSPTEFVGEGENRACYTEDTEVLTENGWKLHKNISLKERIAVYDTEKNECRLEVPRSLHSYHADEELVRFKTSAQDIFVTKEHTILRRGTHWDESSPFRVSKAKDLINIRIAVKSGVESWKGEKQEVSDDYLRFLGWAISEGGLSTTNLKMKRYHMTLAQSNTKPENVVEIRRILNAIGAKSEGYQGIKDNTTRWNIYGKKLIEPLFDLIGAYCTEKKIPRNYLNLPKEKLACLFEALMAGDGSWDKRNNRTCGYYSTTSSQLADDVQELAFKLGYGTKRTVHYLGHGNRVTCHRVLIQKNIVREIVAPKWEKYTGKVYCFSTSTGFYITRRNGCVAVQGNTAYVKRNVTKSRLLYPLMDHIERKVNREVLPYLKGYKKGWKFAFQKDVDLDDDQKIAATASTRAGTVSQYISLGYSASQAMRLAGLKDELDQIGEDVIDDQILEFTVAQMGGEENGGEGGEPADEGRYDSEGAGTEGYVNVNLSDYGQGGENTEQRFGEEDEKQYRKSSDDNAPSGYKTEPAYKLQENHPKRRSQLKSPVRSMEEARADSDRTLKRKQKAGDFIQIKDHVGIIRKAEIITATEKVIKAKVYINSPSEAPKGRTVKRGGRGGYYYITSERQKPHEKPTSHKEPPTNNKKRRGRGWHVKVKGEEEKVFEEPEPPDISGVDRFLIVEGDSISFYLIERGGRISAQALSNAETRAFIDMVRNCFKSNDEDVFDCVRRIAKSQGLIVRVGQGR